MLKSWGYVSLLMGFLSLFFGGLAISGSFGDELLLMSRLSQDGQTLMSQSMDTFAEEKEKNTFILTIGLIFSALGAWMMKSDARQSEDW